MENRRLIKNNVNSLDKIDKHENKTFENKTIICNRIKSISNYFVDLSNNLNDNTTNISIENHSNVNYNLTQTENINQKNNIISYINDKKIDKSKSNFTKSINPKIKIKKNFLKIDNSLMDLVNSSIYILNILIYFYFN